MAVLESLSHSAICVDDLREAEQFYVDVLGAQIVNRVNFSTDDARRGRSIHTNLILGDYLFALMLPKDRMPMPAEDELRGMNGFRHGFGVSRERFKEIQRMLAAQGVAYEGPVEHPKEGPLGESLYFKDPGGNFIEVSWRRDDEHAYNSVMLSHG